MTNPPPNPSAPDLAGEKFPTLVGLGLRASDLAVLSRQGFVAPERRGARVFYKLRFRTKRQIVKYIGSAERAAAVETELAQLQHETRLRRALSRFEKAVRQQLQDGKRLLQPLAESRGYFFHGRNVRLRRQSNPRMFNR